MPESSPETAADHLQQANHLLSVLISDHLPQVQTFRGKWSLINSKLSALRTLLHDFSDFPNCLSNSLSAAVIASVTAALSDAVSLSEKCRNPNSIEGKLKTQSDIDSVTAKLDRLIKDCEILIHSGVLQDDVFSTAAVSSRRDAVRVEARNLVTALQIGAPDSKSSAMDALLGLLHEDDKIVLIAVAQGIVPVLVRLLDSSSLEMKEKAVAAIARVSTVDSMKHVLIAEGLLLLNHLIRITESGSCFAKEKACLALQSLSLSKENARAIGCRGGISSLLEICQAGTPCSSAMAARVLKNLAQYEEIKEEFIEENAIPVLIALSASGTALAQENAMGCLGNLVCEDQTLKLLVAREGGVESLRNYWDSNAEARSLQPAVELLKNLASYSLIAEALVSHGFIGRLVLALNSGVLAVRIAAAGAVYELGLSSKSRKEMGECGGVPPLVKMLDGKAIEEEESAAKALSILMLCACNRKIFKKEERGIVGTVQLLDPSIVNLDKKWPISILSNLVHSNKCRKQMVAAGACVYLQKLVELNVDGAKKLLDSLGHGKLWGVFARP